IARAVAELRADQAAGRRAAERPNNSAAAAGIARGWRCRDIARLLLIVARLLLVVVTGLLVRVGGLLVVGGLLLIVVALSVAGIGAVRCGNTAAETEQRGAEEDRFCKFRPHE